MENIISLNHVSYNIKNSKTLILDDINLNIKQGEFIAVVGKNGSGKSTFAKLLNGILKPTFGNVTINSMNTLDESFSYEIKSTVGMVFQNPDNQIISGTVEEEIAFGLENLCVPQEKMELKIKKSLETVGLNGFEKKSISELSGGQKQCLNIASTISMNPKVIVFDEPTSMIDPQGRKNILNLIKNINKKYRTTIILITHFMEEALAANRILVLEKGILTEEKNPLEFFSNNSFTKCIKPMQSAEILLFLKNLGYDVFMKSFTSHDCAEEIIRILERKKSKC